MSAFNFRFNSSSAACDPEFCRHLRFVLLRSDMDGYLSHDHTTQQHLISVIVGDECLLFNALNGLIKDCLLIYLKHIHCLLLITH